MEVFNALQSLMAVDILVYLAIGVLLGSFIGTLPGLTATMGIALIVPLTFWLQPSQGFAMLIGMWNAAIWSGGISAILINTPGTPASICTTLDGYAMTKQGKAKLALDINTVFSVFGGLFSTFVLILFAFPLAKIALRFGPAEYFSLGIFGLTMMVSIGGKNVLRSICMGIAGILLATIGTDAIVGLPRFTFKNINLLQGINFIAMLIGTFGLSEVLYQIASSKKEDRSTSNIKFGSDKLSFSLFLKLLPSSLASAVTGTIIGTIPAAGGDIASVIVWGQGKKLSKHPEEYGNGSITGLSTTCVANNAVIGGALITMLTLGLPGDTVTAILIGSLISYGVQPGAQMFQDNSALIYIIIALMILANFIILIYGLSMTKLMSKFLSLKREYIWICVSILSIVGSYALQHSLFDVGIMLLFSVIGFFAKHYNFPLGPFVLGFLLSPIIESNFNRSLIMSYNSLDFMWTRPITLMFLVLSAVSIAGSLYIEVRNSKKIVDSSNINKNGYR
ncbi:MAG: hypothetical protein ATN35_00110 [Epulopiscium sp. Nele67-Bin004]|nr:MAG: hypothetical protein ATN35_00110 [Epulopiscium sp. Nele67-Bin004]